MDRQRDPYNGRFGEGSSGNRRPTGSYRSQPSGGYKSRPDYDVNRRPTARTAAGDSYPRRPTPRPEPERTSRQPQKDRRRAGKRLRIAILLLVVLLIAACIFFAVHTRRNRTVHQMPTIERTGEFESVVTEDS